MELVELKQRHDEIYIAANQQQDLEVQVLILIPFPASNDSLLFSGFGNVRGLQCQD